MINHENILDKFSMLKYKIKVMFLELYNLLLVADNSLYPTSFFLSTGTTIPIPWKVFATTLRLLDSICFELFSKLKPLLFAQLVRAFWNFGTFMREKGSVFSCSK